jgi:hypothetical protein
MGFECGASNTHNSLEGSCESDWTFVKATGLNGTEGSVIFERG